VVGDVFVKNKVDHNQLRASAPLIRRVCGYPVVLRETIRAFRGFTPGALAIGGWPGRDINVEVSPRGLVAGKVAIGGTSVAESDVVQDPSASSVGEIDRQRCGGWCGIYAALAERVTVVGAATMAVLMLKVALLAPAGTFKEGGTGASTTSLLDMRTRVSAGAGPVRVTVQTVVSPANTAAGLHDTEATVGKITVSVTVEVSPFVSFRVTAFQSWQSSAESALGVIRL
jgi:hypothetical protein